MTLAQCTKKSWHDTWECIMHSIHQTGDISVMLYFHISRDSEKLVLLKRHPAILTHISRGPGYTRMKKCRTLDKPMASSSTCNLWGLWLCLGWQSCQILLILDGTKSPRFKFPKAQNVTKVGICYAKFIFSLRLHGILCGYC